MFNFFHKIKKIFIAFVSLILCVFLMLLISFYGEKQYQHHCEELGLKCEKGQIHELKDSFSFWLKNKIQEIQKQQN